MKKFLICLLTILGMTTACGQQNYENTDVEGFAKLIEEVNVLVLDVRTPVEYAEGHIDGAINIDSSQDDFVEKVKSTLSKAKKLAIYCRSGRRSSAASEKLAAEGYECVNLLGGFLAWKEAGNPVILSDVYDVDEFHTKSGKMIRFHALVHSSIRIDYNGKEIMIDPVTKLGNKTIDYDAMPQADYIFVTHEHGDHFDMDALKKLTKQGTQLVMNKSCKQMYGEGQAMSNGQRLELDDIQVEAVPAYNKTEGRTQFHPKGRDNGYILTIDGLRIYIAGDTEDIPELADVKDIDIAFLPCNQPYTMTPEQLVKAAQMVKPKVLFPYHYGQTDVSKLPTMLKDNGIDVRIRHYE